MASFDWWTIDGFATNHVHIIHVNPFIETNGSLVITEQKFEEFDIKTLVEYSLLRNEYNKSSNNIRK